MTSEERFSSSLTSESIGLQPTIVVIIIWRFPAHFILDNKLRDELQGKSTAYDIDFRLQRIPGQSIELSIYNR